MGWSERTKLKISIEIPAGSDMVWTEKAAESLISQTTDFKVTEHIVYPAEIRSARVVRNGEALIIEAEVDVLHGTAATPD